MVIEMEWYYLALMSASLSAAAAIFEKKTLFKEDALDFSAGVAVLNMIFAIPFFFFVDYDKVTLISLGVLFFKSILGAIAFLYVMKSIKNLEISGALPLLVLTPGLVAIFALILLGESLSSFQIIGLLGLLIGTYILQMKKDEGLLEPFKIFIKSKYMHYVIIALSLFTLTSILDKMLLSQYKLPPNAFLGFQHIFLGIIFVLMVLISKRKVTTLAKTFRMSFKWLAIVSVLTIGYRYSQILAVKASSSVALVLALKRVSVFFATILGGQIFKESHLVRKGIATFVMIISAALVIIY